MALYVALRRISCGVVGNGMREGATKTPVSGFSVANVMVFAINIISGPIMLMITFSFLEMTHKLCATTSVIYGKFAA